MTTEADIQDRILDATEHDEIYMLFGDPETGRPLIHLSVTKEGRGIIEYADERDLAAGIRQINALVSRDSNRSAPPAQRVTRHELEAALALRRAANEDGRFTLPRLCREAPITLRAVGDMIMRWREAGYVDRWREDSEVWYVITARGAEYFEDLTDAYR